ncbi:type IVB secretion system protein IcmW [Piscirickettsia litoralis]|uniref:type IVB secretion system protein IcmW n=1 Tax=Piscirickettsia litoralis TaxID=1891921 RepID=UPI001F408A7D|nr:type IVB secretion system protein IcmW [Piscirickettsia litoralis]
MLPFRKKVADYWKSYENSNINHALINFEKIEKEIYLLDEGNEDKLSKFLEFSSKNSLKDVSHEEILLLLNSLPAAYMFYVVHEINGHNPEYISSLISKANKNKGSNDDYKFFYNRNVLFERMQILSRIFFIRSC